MTRWGFPPELLGMRRAARVWVEADLLVLGAGLVTSIATHTPLPVLVFAVVTALPAWATDLGCRDLDPDALGRRAFASGSQALGALVGYATDHVFVLSAWGLSAVVSLALCLGVRPKVRRLRHEILGGGGGLVSDRPELQRGVRPMWTGGNARVAAGAPSPAAGDARRKRVVADRDETGDEPDHELG